jgi:hypothetical protein
MQTNILNLAGDVVVRRNAGGIWSVELPHAERADAVFITYVTDKTEALWLAEQMRPDSTVRVIAESDEETIWEATPEAA